MGYASEEGSYQNALRHYYSCSIFIMPGAFLDYKLLGLHAKLLYRLWKIKAEIMFIDNAIEKNNDLFYRMIIERKEHLLYYEETDFSEASLIKYRKKLEKKLKEMQKEIEVFRENSLK
jgi:hypothetical protein